MARIDPFILPHLRRRRLLRQRQLAEQLRVTQAQVSRIEHAEDLALSTLDRYVAALGGRLTVLALFDDETVPLWTTEDGR